MKEKNRYNAIVIGTGISGGWAIKELTEKGLRVLALERGCMVEHIKDYATANKAPWEMPHRGQLTHSYKNENPFVVRAGVVSEYDYMALTARAANYAIEELKKEIRKIWGKFLF